MKAEPTSITCTKVQSTGVTPGARSSSRRKVQSSRRPSNDGLGGEFSSSPCPWSWCCSATSVSSSTKRVTTTAPVTLISPTARPGSRYGNLSRRATAPRKSGYCPTGSASVPPRSGPMKRATFPAREYHPKTWACSWDERPAQRLPIMARITMFPPETKPVRERRSAICQSDDARPKSADVMDIPQRL